MTYFSVFSFGLSITVLLLTVFWKWFSHFKVLKAFATELEGPEGLPIIGCLHKFVGVKAEDLYAAHVKLLQPFNSKRLKLWFGPIFVFISRSPQDVKTILNSDESQDRPLFFYKMIIKNGIAVMNGQEAEEHRKAITPAFAPKQLQKYLPMINEIARKFLRRFESRLMTKNVNDVHLFSQDFALEASLVTMFGNEEIEEEERHKIIKAYQTYLHTVITKAKNPWLLNDFIFKFSKYYDGYKKNYDLLLKFSEKLAKDHEEEFPPNMSAKPKPYLDNLYELRDTVDYMKHIEGIVMFVGASFDTAGGTIANTLMLLGMNQEAQEEAFLEIKSVLSSNDDELDEEKMEQLVYLDMVIKESLRLIPIGLTLGRKATADLKLDDSTVVPKGTNIVIDLLGLHTDKQVWGQDAKLFKPERFSGESFESIPQYSYVPFAGGSRMCLGFKFAQMTMKVFLARFLMNYRVSSELKCEEIEIQMKIAAYIKQGYDLKIERR